MKELDKLMASLELLKRINLIEHDLGILEQQITRLPEFVNRTTLEILNERHLIYTASKLKNVRENLYSELYKEFSIKKNILKKNKEELFNAIMLIQSYPSADYQE